MPEQMRLSRRSLLGLISGALSYPALLAACGGSDESTPTIPDPPSPTPTPTLPPRATPIPDLGLVNAKDDARLDVLRADELNAAGHYDEVRVAEDGTRHLIPLGAVEWGGVAKDGIPSLDAPSYVGPDRWSQMVYDPGGLVIGVEVNGKHRAYPLQILIWHEIVNETFDGSHLLVTY